MVLAKIFTFPDIIRAKNNRLYWYIDQRGSSVLCDIVLKIIPENYRVNIGDIVNVRDGTGKKPQITIIQHDRPIDHPVIFYLAYFGFMTPKQRQDVIPLITLRQNSDILRVWYGYTQHYSTTEHHFFVLTKKTTLEFEDVQGNIRKEVVG